MFNLLKTPEALFAPHGCMICGSGKGPILDLMQEFSAQQLRLYLCKIHYVQVARDAGLIKGDAMDELLRVRETLTAKEHEHEQLGERFTALRRDLELLLARYDEKEAEAEHERQRADQLQQQLNDVREATTATLAATQEPEYEPALD